MTNGLGLFLAFYILVGQPAILGRMLDNCSLYQLAGLNAGIFFIAWIVSAICKSPKKKTNADSITSQLLGENTENSSGGGVSVVKVQETTVKEIEVAKVEVKEEKLPQPEKDIEGNNEEIKNHFAGNSTTSQNPEENKEEKSEDKIPERPMRESVTIPKIVQPISGHQVPKKKKKDLKWGQWLVLLLTLGVATIIAWTLREFLGNRGIAIALFLGWILYLVIGKLFDIDGFYNAKKLFTNWLYIILIISGIGYGIYTTQNDASLKLLKDKAVSYIQDRLKSEENNIENPEIDTGDIIYVFEGTGEVIKDIEDEVDTLNETGDIGNITGDAENTTWVVENIQNETGTTENINLETEVQPEPIIENQTSNLSSEDAKKQVTMGEAIKSLVGGSKLSTKTNISFKYVSKSNELYPYFKTAQEKWMIGTDTDPSKIVSCDTYITMKGIREGREVGNYTKDNVKAVYWAKAEKLGKLNGCQKGKYVTKGNL